MALKFKYKAKDEIPTEHQSLYVERDGAFVLDAEGAVEKSKLDEFRTNNLALKKQLDDLAHKYEGIDPDGVKALLADKARLEEEKLIKDGEVEKLVERRIKAVVGEWEKRATAAEQQAAALNAQLVETEINRGVITATSKLGLRPSAMPDITARARNVFKIVGGVVTAVDSDGKTPIYGKDGVTPLSLEDWAARQVVEAPHLFESNAGGGATGSGSGGAVNGRKNPFKRGPEWNLTEQMKLQKTDPKLAERLRAAA